jgi:hypothetical protein
MASDLPLSHLALSASSVADDLSFVALADLATAIPANTSDCRIIGGHMVTVLAARWGLGSSLYRETADADLGVAPIVVRAINLTGRLSDLGYERVAGNRFVRAVRDIPINLTTAEGEPHRSVIDILVPAYTSRARENVEVTEELITTEVPGLAAALGRPAVTMTLDLRRLSGETQQAVLPFPDEVSALVLKGLATRVRVRATDVTDIWRCLEIALAAGIRPADFQRSGRSEAAATIVALFEHRHGPGITVLQKELHLSKLAADQRFTRIRAILTRVLGLS